MNKQRYHVAQSDEGWEVMDADDIAVNPEPFRTRGEADRFLRGMNAVRRDRKANDRYWSRLESRHEDHYEFGD